MKVRFILFSSTVVLKPSQHLDVLGHYSDMSSLEFGHFFHQNRICILSRNSRFLENVARAVEELTQKHRLKVEICKKVITRSPQDPCGDEYFNNAGKVIFVAVSEPRLLLISDKEESQLGNLYYRAEKLKVTPFLILAGHQESEYLPDTDPYSPSLNNICKNQPEIEMLAKTDSFISVGYMENPEQLSFGQYQKGALKRWMYKSIS